MLPEAPAVVGCDAVSTLTATRVMAARMTNASDGKRDFFISFNKADRSWAIPLALAQARAFMRARKVDLAGYRHQLAAMQSKVLAWHRPEADYQLSVAQTWQASMTAATEDCPVARHLLELLAFLAPENIPRTLLGAEPEALPEGLREAFDRDSAIEALHRFSLLRADPATLTVHRLVQAVTRDGLNAAMAKGHAMAVLQLVNAALLSWGRTNWPATEALRTILLMERFYQNLLAHDGKAPQPPAGALYKAQLWLRDAMAGEMALAERWRQIYQTTTDRELAAIAFRNMCYYASHPEVRPFAGL